MSREEGRRRAGPEFSEHRRRPGSPRSSPSGRGRPQRGFTSGRGRYGEPRPSDIPAPLLSALDKGEVFCNAWTLRFTKPVQAWGYPLKIWESTLGESPEAITQPRVRRQVGNHLVTTLLGGEALRQRISGRARGAEYSAALGWLVIYNAEVKESLPPDRRFEVPIEDKQYSIELGTEKPLQGKDWHFYLAIAANRILAAANFRRAFGQSLYLEVDEDILQTKNTLRGLEATIMKSGDECLLRVSAKKKELETEPMDKQISKGLSRRICVAIHNQMFYRIVEVTETVAENQTFNMRGEDVTVAQYFSEHHKRDVTGQRLLKVKKLRGPQDPVFLPANLVRTIKTEPQAAGRKPIIPTARQTLIEVTDRMNYILKKREVQSELEGLSLQMGEENALPLELSKYIENIRDIFLKERDAYGSPEVSWGTDSDKRKTIELVPDFRRELTGHMVLQHKVPLDEKWILVICGDMQRRESEAKASLIGSVIEITRRRFRSINMQEFQDVVHFLKRADDWNKGEVEQTKRQLRDKLESYVQKVRGAVVLLSYTDAADNDKVRIAVKQVSIQLDFPVQHIKHKTVQDFYEKDKSMNLWWNVYLQFQTKILDKAQAGIPCSDLATGSRTGFVALVGGRNAEVTQFVSHYGVSDKYFAGVCTDLRPIFAAFWRRLFMHYEKKKTSPRASPCAHLVIYRSAASGSSQNSQILEYELAAIREAVDSTLGTLEFDPTSGEMSLKHPAVDQFPDAHFLIRCRPRPRGMEAEFAGKAERMPRTKENFKNISAKGPSEVSEEVVGSQQRRMVKFAFDDNEEPALTFPMALSVKKTLKTPEAYQVYVEEKDGKDVAFVKIPTAHPIFVYGHSNSLFLLTLKFFFTKEEKGSEQTFEVTVPFDASAVEMRISVKEISNLKDGDTIFLQDVELAHAIQRVNINIVVNPDRASNPLRYFQKKRDIQGLEVGSVISRGVFERSGPAIRPDDELSECTRFFIGTADPRRGCPAASEFTVLSDESKWSPNFYKAFSYRLCHMFYNWAGTVKHPHVLGMALNIARNHAIYAASGSDFGLKGELSESRPSGASGEEELESQERRQKRREESGARYVGPEKERNAGMENLRELKRTLENVDSRLMRTAFML